MRARHTPVPPDAEGLRAELHHGGRAKRFDDASVGAALDLPFVAVGDADDACFGRIKEVVGEFYWTRHGPWATRWSERHAAFAAGLATFGLSGG
jgi:hypothetical protein